MAEVSSTTLDKIEKFDNTGFITDTTVCDEFGTATVLTTWLVHDNYGFVTETEIGKRKRIVNDMIKRRIISNNFCIEG